MEVTSEARSALRPGEARVFDWHRVAICCAVAGEVSLRRLGRRWFRSNLPPDFGLRAAFGRLPDRREGGET